LITVNVQCDWQELKTDDGQPYYWNAKTGESVWEKPAELVAFEKASKPAPPKALVEVLLVTLRDGDE
jgi:hypothetical protein